MFTLNVELFWSLFVFGIRVRGPGRFCRSSSFFFHWPAELLTSFVRHHRSGVQKKQDDTRQSSNGPRTRTPPTDVITAWQAKPDLKTINFNEKRFSDKVTQLSIIQFFLCQVVLTWDGGFYAGRPLERERVSGSVFRTTDGVWQKRNVKFFAQ